jgi:p-hydroxybenzoate 3-monooxygenase
MTEVERTQVAIVGAGPAGLVLSHLLARAGIDSVVLEDRAREYVEHRVRAGVLEQPSVDLLTDLGLAERLRREGLVHEGIKLQFEGQRHRIAMTELTGRSITIYGQQELVKDLIAARLAAGLPLHFEVQDVRFEGVDGTWAAEPVVRYRDHEGVEHELRCHVLAGCDGSRGVSRTVIPERVLTHYHHDYPFAWLGVLAQVAPSTDELIYAYTDRGFALHSLRSPSISRLYLQVDPTESIEKWPDDRIWDELATRFALPGWELKRGPVLEKGITPLRSEVYEPMQYGRLFLAGDAAHIVPATGAKGLNLAVSDVNALAEGVVDWCRSGSRAGLDGYSRRCLTRVWRVQDFSTYMSRMLHLVPGADAFERRLQLAQLRYVTSSEAAARSLAENYTGLPFS